MHRTSLDAADHQLRGRYEGRPSVPALGRGPGQESLPRTSPLSTPTRIACRLTIPRAWAFPETQKIFQTPTELVILHEFNASYRQIFFDGRKLPEDMLPTWDGYSVAHWEGDTLVVESAGYRDDSWLDTAGNFFSSGARVTERIRRPNFGDLDMDVTVNDPKVFTKPWTVALHMRPLVDTEMIDFICQDNNKDLQHLVR